MRPDPAIRLALGPILLRQGKHVRQTALKLPEPTGPRGGRLGSGPSLRLLILGDSSAAGVGVDRQEQALSGRISARLAEHFAVEWDLIAKTGATTKSTLKRIQQTDRSTYDVVVLAVGVNDVTAGVAAEDWLRNQTQLWDLLTSEFGAKRIIVTGFPPVRRFPLLPQPLRWFLGRQAEHFDRQLRGAAAARPDVSYVAVELAEADAVALMAKDGFHPGPEIYNSWAGTIAAAIIGDLLLK